MSTFTRPKPAGTPTWVDLMTPDVAKARDFYTALFGWNYIVSGPEMGYYSLAQVDGKMAAGIGQMQPGSNMPSAWTIYLASADIQADSAQIKKLGGQVIMEAMPIPEQGSMAICVDPTGAPFGLWQAGQHIGATITEVPGTMGWYEVITRNAVQARDFYCKLYNLTWEPMQGMEYYILKRGEANVAGVLQMDQNWPDTVPAHWKINFAVSSAPDTCSKAVQNGGKVRVEPFDSPYGPIAELEDPFGAFFAIVAMTPQP